MGRPGVWTAHVSSVGQKGFTKGKARIVFLAAIVCRKRSTAAGTLSRCAQSGSGAVVDRADT